MRLRSLLAQSCSVTGPSANESPARFPRFFCDFLVSVYVQRETHSSGYTFSLVFRVIGGCGWDFGEMRKFFACGCERMGVEFGKESGNDVQADVRCLAHHSFSSPVVLFGSARTGTGPAFSSVPRPTGATCASQAFTAARSKQRRRQLFGGCARWWRDSHWRAQVCTPFYTLRNVY